MTGVVTPFDKFFRSAMHDLRIAQGFFELYLPHEVEEKLDLCTLMLENSSFIDSQLNEFISDLVYRCEYKDKSLGDARVIVLVEHQSTPQKFMPVRVYHYLFGILINEIKQLSGKEKLPAIYAMVFYHGEQSPYPYSLKLSDCFNDPKGVMDYFWQNPVPLVDVNTIEDNELLKHQLQGTHIQHLI